MKKRLLSIGLALLMLLLLSGTAFADNTIIANLGSAEAGRQLDQLVGTTSADTVRLIGGALPEGCEIVTEPREDGAQHYLRGTPMTAGTYEFSLAVGGEEAEESVTLTCSLSVTPAVPVISPMEDLSISVGDEATLSCSASVPDAGVLSYQWYANDYSNNQNGSLLVGAVEPSLSLSTAMPGRAYYYCVVTNTNGGLSSSAASPAVAVSISEPELVAISVSVMPAKRQFTVGEALDVSGLELLLRYSNGSTATLNSGFEAEPHILETSGTQSVTIRYEGLSCTYPVLVEEAAEEILSLSLLNQPSRREYTVGDWLDTTGITLRVQTNKGSYDVTSGFACNPRVLEQEGQQTITVSYGQASTSFTVTVKAAEKTLESISVLRRPTKLSYTVGDSFDPSGMTLSLVTSEGVEEISSGFNCMPTQLLREGTQTITITYKGLSCSFDLVVSAKAEETAPPVETPAPSETVEPAAPTPSPAVTPKPDIRPERQTNGLVLGIVIASAVALAALLAYVYVVRQDKIRAFVQKLRDLFTEK